MTDFTTIVVPRDGKFVPTQEAAARGKSFLEESFPDCPVTIGTHSAPRFITSGDDFDKFTCPRCKKLVERYYLDDAGKDWWYTVLWNLRDQDQVLTVPCCGAEVTVKEIDFGSDAAFASFTLSVEGVGGLGELKEFGEENRRKLESVLGCSTLWIVEVAT